MLVLSRRKNESIRIDNDIVVTVVSIEGDKVKLGFDAPKEIGIYRTELLGLIEDEMESKDQAGSHRHRDNRRKKD